MRVQVTGDWKKPIVNTSPCSRRRGKQVVQKTWKLAGHGNLPAIVESSLQMFASEPSISSSSSTICCSSVMISASRFCGEGDFCAGCSVALTIAPPLLMAIAPGVVCGTARASNDPLRGCLCEFGGPRALSVGDLAPTVDRTCEAKTANEPQSLFCQCFHPS